MFKRCWQVRRCKRDQCPAYTSNEALCWRVSDGYCCDEEPRRLPSTVQSPFQKADKCIVCEYFTWALSATEETLSADDSLVVGAIHEDAVSFLTEGFIYYYEVSNKSREECERRRRDLVDAYRQLRISQRQILQSERLAAIGQLAAGVAHEINNPLGGILTFAKLCLKKLDRLMTHVDSSNPDVQKSLGEVADHLHRIDEETERCSKIVLNLLNFSRSEARKVSLVDVHDILRQTLALVEHQAKVQNIRIAERFSYQLPPVWADGDQLEQVFLNILLNAIQAIPAREVKSESTTPDGDGSPWDLIRTKRDEHYTGKITVVTKYEPGEIDKSVERKSGLEPEAVIVEISDTGSGIPRKDLPRVFDPFFSTKDKNTSTGLGLSVAYGIINGHGGTISINSIVGKGTTVTISLPVGAPENPSIKQTTSVSEDEN